MIYSNKFKNKFFLLLTLLILSSCGGGEDEGGEEEVKTPKATLLVFPLEDSECNEGTVVSDTESRVTFEWNEAQDTDSYTLVLTNLSDNTTRNINTINTSKSETILRGVPYSWYIVSKANGTAVTANSSTWKFYNAGVGIENYAPFPAELVSPTMGGLASSTPSLEWKGSDIDNDIASYDVYFGISNPPTVLLENTTSTRSNAGSLNPNTVYYWSVTTKDSHGNNSQSPVFEFRTQ